MAANMESTAQMTQIMASFVKMISAILAPEEKHSNERLEAMKKCSELIMAGDPGCYKLFSREDEIEMEKLLLKEKIPFIPVASGNNQTILVVPKKYEGEFLQVQESFRYTDMKSYKDVDERNMLDSIKSLYDAAPLLRYESQELASLAAEKLYASGMTCSIGKNTDGSYDIIVHPQSMYKNGPGSDFTMFEVLMAYEQSKNSPALGVGDEWQNMRIEQAKYDEGRMEDFARRALNGEHVVLADLSPNKKGKLYIEAKNGEIFINTKRDDGTWKRDVCKNCNNLLPDDIKKMCSCYTEKLKNMGVITNQEFEEQYKDKVPARDYRTPENRRPVFSNGELERIGREELKPLLNQLQRDAGRKCKDHYKNTNKSVDRTDLSSISKALSLQKEEVIKCLKDANHPLVAQFIAKPGPLSTVQRQAWLLDIAKQLEGTGRTTPLDTRYSEASVKDLVKRANSRAVERSAEWQAEKETEETKD